MLNVLPAQALSVPCKQLFSGMKQIAEDYQLHLGLIMFKELAIMNLEWGPELYNMATWNASQVEEVMDFKELLTKDVNCLAWDKELDLNRDLDGFDFIV